MERFSIVHRPSGTWFLSVRSDVINFEYKSIGYIIDFMSDFSKFLDTNVTEYKFDACFRDGLNWKEAAEFVTKEVETQEDCANKIKEIFGDAQKQLDNYLNRQQINNHGTELLIQAANRKTYGYESTMSVKEKIEQMILNKFALEALTFKEL